MRDDVTRSLGNARGIAPTNGNWTYGAPMYNGETKSLARARYT